MKKVYFNSLSFIVDEGVYEPSDDSFLLAKNCPNAQGDVLDVGTGCGIGAIVACAANGKNRAIGTDINEGAVENAKENARMNGVDGRCSFIRGDLFESVEGKFDLILFNPPYLPTKNEDGAWDGGKDGRKVIDRFLEGFGEHLKQDGRLFMIDSSLDNTEKTVGKLEKKGFSVRVLEKKHVWFETISVLEARWRAW